MSDLFLNTGNYKSLIKYQKAESIYNEYVIINIGSEHNDWEFLQKVHFYTPPSNHCQHFNYIIESA